MDADIQIPDEILTQDERMRLFNMWQRDLKHLADKLKLRLNSDIKEHLMGQETMTDSMFSRYKGIMEGINLYCFALSGEVTNFEKEMSDGQRG